MRASAWLLGLLAMWAAFAGTARAQDDDKAFRPLEFLPDEETWGADAVARVALTSPTEGEVTVAQGARPVKGTWSVIGGPRLRLVGPDGTVRSFDVKKDAVSDGLGRYLPRASSAWLAAVASDPLLRAEPPLIPVRISEEDVCHLRRLPGGEGDWVASQRTVAVRVEERDAGALLVRFPDGTERHLVLDAVGSSYDDAAANLPRLSVEELRRRACLENLKGVAQLFVAMRSEKMGKPSYDGVALLLSWRAKKNPLREGDEGVLRCPGDPDLLPLTKPGVRELYDSVDLKNPGPGLCSYAGRDWTHFPLSADSSEREPIACCRQGADGRTPHHKGGICVAFDDATSAFLTPKELGLGPEDPIVVGPDSKSPLLRKLLYIKKPK